MPSLEQFEKMVNGHDLTYSYSDDYRAYRNGESQWSKIKEAAKELPSEDVARIWNTMVDKTLAEGFRDSFYWSDKWIGR